MAISAASVKQRLQSLAASTAASGFTSREGGGAPPAGGPQGVFDVSNDGINWEPVVRLRADDGAAFTVVNGIATIAGNALDYILEVDFDKPGTTLPTGARGEIVNFSRASSATYYLNGVLTTVGVDVPRITPEGLIIEPAITNTIPTPENLSGWTLNNVTRSVGGGAVTPEGGRYTRLTMVADVGTTHGAFTAVPDPGTTSTFSFHVAKQYGGGARYVQIQDNANTHICRVDLLTGVIVQKTATHTVGRCSDLGSEWRISISCDETIVTGALWCVFSNANPGTAAPLCNGAITDWIDVRRAQLEPLDYPTSWTANTRAADICWVQPKRQLPSEIRIECDFQAVDGNNMRGSTHCPLVAVGDRGTANSSEVYLASGSVAFSVFDASAAEKIKTANLGTAGGLYTGPRYIVASSFGYTRPALFVSGIESTAAVSGAGTGVSQTLAPNQTRVRLGYTSTSGVSNGYVGGGVIIKRLAILANAKPTTMVSGAYSYREPLSRGYATDSNTAAAFGDSITDAVLVDPTNIYESWTRVAARIKSNYIIHNYGVGSNGVEQIAIRWREHARGRGYKTIIVQGGINNANVDQSAAEIWAITSQWLGEIVVDGATKVICIGLMPGNDAAGSSRFLAKSSYNALLSAWCAARPTVASYLDAWALMTDGSAPEKIAAAYDQATPASLHLNQTGNDRLGAAVAALL